MNEISMQMPMPVENRLSRKIRAWPGAAVGGVVSACRATGNAFGPYVPTMETLRHFTLNVLIVAGAFLGVAIVIKASLRSYVTIDTINVPRTLADRGFTGEVIAQRIHDEITEIGRVSRLKRPLGEFSTFSFERTLPKIDLPVGGMSLAMVVGSLRDFMGLIDTKIAGEVIIDDDAATPGQKKKYWLRLRISDRGTVYRHSEPIENLDALFHNAAMQVIERFDPHVAAGYYYVKNDYDNALRMVSRALNDSNTGNDALSLNLRGLIAKAQHRYDDALAQFHNVRARFPDYVPAQHNIATTLLTKRLPKEALVEAERGIKIDPDRPNGYINAGWAHLMMRHYDDALRLFEKATEVAPTSGVGYLNQAEVHRLRPDGDRDKAIALYQRAADIDPHDPRIFLSWGIVMEERQDYRQAQLLFERAIDARPDWPRGYELLGVLLLREQKWKKAGEAFAKALSFAPTNPQLHFHLGRAMRDAGRLDEAAKALRRTIELNEKHALAHAVLATTVADMVRLARSTYDTASDKEEAEQRVSVMLDDVQDLLDQATEIAPRHGAVLRQVGRAYEALERYEEAVEAFRRAIAADEVHNAGLQSDIDRLGRRIASL